MYSVPDKDSTINNFNSESEINYLHHTQYQLVGIHRKQNRLSLDIYLKHDILCGEARGSVQTFQLKGILDVVSVDTCCYLYQSSSD